MHAYVNCTEIPNVLPQDIWRFKYLNKTSKNEELFLQLPLSISILNR